MKTTYQMIQLILLSIALFSSTLLAQNNYGNDKYPIGSNEDPASVYELTLFLQDKASSDTSWIRSKYYDSSLIVAYDTGWDGLLFDSLSFQRPIIRLGSSGAYEYFYFVYCKHDRVVAVNSSAFQQEFTDWRVQKRAEFTKNNPNRQELCDYINDKIAGRIDSSYLDKASEIQRCYPHAAPLDLEDLYDYNEDQSPLLVNDFRTLPPPSFDYVLQTLWQQVDELVTHIYGHDDLESTPRTHYAASDEECNNFVQRWGMVFSNESDPSLAWPAGMPKHVVLLDKTTKDDVERWAAKYPNGYSLDPNSITLNDTAIVTDPVVPSAPDNSEIPAMQAPVTQD